MISNSIRNRCPALVAAALLVGLVSAAGPAAAEGDGDALATYNGKTYTVGEFNEAIERLNPRARKSLEDADRRKQFLENQVLSTLIYENGVAAGLDKDPEVARQLAEYERHIVIQKVMQENQAATVEDSEVRAYYDDNPAEFTSDRTKASHILVAEEELARDLHKQITEDPSKFEELAKEHSTDRSNSKRGGDLGFFGRGLCSLGGLLRDRGLSGLSGFVEAPRLREGGVGLAGGLSGILRCGRGRRPTPRRRAWTAAAKTATYRVAVGVKTAGIRW